MVSEATLISMPANGFAASMNHCISASWSARDQRRQVADFCIKEGLGLVHAGDKRPR